MKWSEWKTKWGFRCVKAVVEVMEEYATLKVKEAQLTIKGE